ncbi:MAG: dethiobiotin synthase, partial [Candidatus Omnitrophota bacterium]
EDVYRKVQRDHCHSSRVFLQSKGMNKAIFITGTDTGVGKTVVTGLLGKFLLEKGINVATQKWVQTGCIGFSEDIALHMKLMGRTQKDIENYFSEVAPYVLEFPSSPHLAAELEKKRIDTAKIKESFLKLQREFDIVLVEGAGGLMVPIDDEKMMIDLVGEIGLPVLVVAENKLGAINQTILTIEALRKRDMDIAGVIFNQRTKSEDELILKDNPKIVGKLTGVEILGELSFSEKIEDLYEAFRPIAERLKI